MARSLKKGPYVHYSLEKKIQQSVWKCRGKIGGKNAKRLNQVTLYFRGKQMISFCFTSRQLLLYP